MTAGHGGSRRSSGRNSRGHRTGPGRGRGRAKNIRNPSNNPTNTTLSEAMERYGSWKAMQDDGWELTDDGFWINDGSKKVLNKE